MYWWKASKLAVDFREGRVDEQEKFKYYLATIVAWNIVAQTLFRYGDVSVLEHLLCAGLILIINVVGIVLCFGANKRGDDTDFVPRMICLGWPVGIRLAVTFSAIMLVIVLGASLPAKAVGPEAYWSVILATLQRRWNTLSGLLGIYILLGYYWEVYGHLISIAQERGAENLIHAQKADWSPGKIAFAVAGGTGVPIIFILVWKVVLDLGEYNELAGLLSISAVVLWLVLFGYLLVWLQRSFPKHPLR